jgi:preprotein translocase subunit SecF
VNLFLKGKWWVSLEEDKKQINENIEVDLLDKEGHKEKLEVFEQKEEPIKEEEIIKPKEPKKEEKQEAPKEKFSFIRFYDKSYKKLMIIPMVMLVLAIIVIGVQTTVTGSFIHKDVSLKGGVTLTITKEEAIDIVKLERFLEGEFINNDISVRAIKKGGVQIGTIVAADIDGTDKAALDSFIDAIESGIGHELNEEDYGIEVMGSSLGASFFKETFIALIAAFILMSLVILIYFRSFVPSLAIMLAAFSDIIVTLAIVDLLGMKLSTGGIAAFLMLIGYSVDTNVLLNTRVMKRKEGTVFERVIGAVKTGLMMTVTTVGALSVGIIFVQSEVIRQIMIIVLIGLLVDIINTWVQNVGILRYYIERK